MITVKITKKPRWFIIDIGGDEIYLLNRKSIIQYLRNIFGQDEDQTKVMLSMLSKGENPTLYFEWDNREESA
jgi:hypothetical protein